MCLAAAVVGSWWQVAGLSSFTVMTNIFVTEFAEFSGTFRIISFVTLNAPTKYI